MKKYIISLVAVLVFSPMVAGASQVMYPAEGESNTAVTAGSYKDLYVGGNTVTVESDIGGDLFVGGGTVMVSGAVAQDLFSAGGNTVITSPVAGDARLVGGNIMITAPIEEDLMAAGGTITITDKGSVGGDLWLASGIITVNGTVSGDLKIAGGEVLINSTVKGSVDIRADRLTFGPKANVMGAITYHGANEAVVSPDAKISTIDFQKYERKGGFGAIFTIGLLLGFIAIVAAALLLFRFFGHTVQTTIETAHHSPWKSLGIGLLTVIVLPIGAILMLVSVVGSYIALVVGAWFVLMLLLTSLISIIFVGNLLMKWFRQAPALTLSWQGVLLGAVALFVLRMIPFAGHLIYAGVMLISFGALLQTAKHQIVNVHMRRSG